MNEESLNNNLKLNVNNNDIVKIIETNIESKEIQVEEISTEKLEGFHDSKISLNKIIEENKENENEGSKIDNYLGKKIRNESIEANYNEYGNEEKSEFSSMYNNNINVTLLTHPNYVNAKLNNSNHNFNPLYQLNSMNVFPINKQINTYNNPILSFMYASANNLNVIQYPGFSSYTNDGKDFELFQQINFLNEKKRIYSIKEDNAISYKMTDYSTYALDFQNNHNQDVIALGSLEYSNENYIEILYLDKEILKTGIKISHEYPISKIQWNPFVENKGLFGVTSDNLKIFNYDNESNQLTLKSSLINNRSEYNDPITSFDWNKLNDSIIGTCSLDTTCTIWDINKETIKTQLIAHEKEVYDIGFSYTNENLFMSSGSDGSIRIFDMRNLEENLIKYESEDKSPIYKFSWNYKNKDLFAICSGSQNNKSELSIVWNKVHKRKLSTHNGSVTSFCWSPENQNELCSVGDDGFAYIWKLKSEYDESKGPDLQYSLGDKKSIRNVSWSKSNPKLIGIVYENKIRLLNM